MSAHIFTLVVTSSVNSFETIRRFPKNITIAELKQKVELLTGASSTLMELHLLDKNKQYIMKMDDETKDLESYPVQDDMYVHVHDPTLKTGEFEDVSAVSKFEISEEEYRKREKSFRAFKSKFQEQNLSEEEIMKRKAEREKKIKADEELMKSFHIGDRCEVSVSGQPKKKGTIMYLGKTEFKPGFWVGVKYDMPLGKNDGSFHGKRYFECESNHGSFVKPQDVNVNISDEQTPEEI